MSATFTTAGRRLEGRALPGWRQGGLLPVALGIVWAAAVGYAAGEGDWELAVAAATAPVFVIAALAMPERVALGLIVVLPFFIYPLTTGTLSVFLAVPLFAFVGLVLILREPGALSDLRWQLPLTLFVILLAIAVVMATLSADSSFGYTRVIYLGMLGWFAWALAASLRSGRLTRESVAKAIVYGSALAAIAVIVQFMAQFGSGRASVLDWLRDVLPTFAGQRAVAGDVSNVVIQDPDVVRGIFPFMSPPSAGQYLMFGLIAAVWLRRERAAATGTEAMIHNVAFALIAVGLVMTFSRQSWIGAVVGIAALGLRRPAWMLVATVAIFLVASIAPAPGGGGTIGSYFLTGADTSTTSSSTRIDLWEQAIDLIPGHELIGVGPGQIGSLNPDPSNPVYYAHNVFLDAAVELGLAGAIVLVALFLTGIGSAFRRQAMLAVGLLSAYVVANLFDDVFYFPRNMLLLAVAFALIAGPRGSPREEPEPG